MSENLNKFKQVLSTIFEMDKADLDFGIYRIINQKRNEINSFLDNDLLPQVKKELAQYENKDEARVKEELSELIQDAEKLGAVPDSMPKIKELRKKLQNTTDIAALESEVFSHLTTFFRRYYDKGDFISKRRYKEGVYAIPYEGEEVKLYWANHDQYYIKTTENLNNYTFKAGSKKIHFRLTQGEQTKDNIKSGDEKNRKFVLDEVKNYEIQENELFIYFNFKSDTRNQTRTKSTKKADFSKHLNVSIALELLSQKDIAKTFPELGNIITSSAIPELTLLEKHLNDYTARNSFDYFIHKDLGGFLRRELDFFIKNEVMHIDDLDTDHELEVQQYLSKIKVIKRIGHKIIKFLEQLENFQKKLWLKKKFVVKSNWCLTLDRVPEELYPEIIKNTEQIEEWKSLFAIDEMTEPPVLKKDKKTKKEAYKDEDSLFEESDENEEDNEDEDAELTEEDVTADETPAAFVAYSESLTVEFLKANPYLVLDTKFFDADTKWKILSSIEDIDEECDGLLINSENFQAIGLLQEKFREKVKCVYIDPPYNTSASEILYKNNYRHSSWLTFLNNTLQLSYDFLDSNKGMLCATIDDVEHKLFSLLIENVYGELAGTVSIRIKPSGRPIPNGFALSHEYAMFARRNIDYPISRLEHDDVQIARYKDSDEKGKFFWEMFRKAGSGSNRLDRPTMFYPFFYNKSSNKLRIPVMSWDEYSLSYNISDKPEENEITIYPIKDDNSEGRWYFGLDRAYKVESDFKIVETAKDIFRVYYKRRPNEGIQPTTVWFDSKYSATEHGTALLKHIFGKQEIFSYPKSIHAVRDCIKVSTDDNNSIILDYFAGSGTTGHAVINLNREDGGSRKYILIEMGQYFDTVLKPRIQKVIYSKDWKEGKPVSRKGSSHIFKYMSLESYEDTLNNLTLGEKLLIDDLPPDTREEYMLNYMLDLETKESASLLNIDTMKDPFNYCLKIIHENELVYETIDLIETFNYLLGLSVKKYHAPAALHLSFEHTEDKRLEVKDAQGKEIFTFQAVEGTNRDNETVLVIWRIITDNHEKDDAALRYYCGETFSLKDYDRVYINGDCTLGDVHLTEEHFKKLMFDVRDV